MTIAARQSYAEYIHSDAWRSRQSLFLKAADYRCSCFPWRRLGKGLWGYNAYAIHHLSAAAYDRQGHERYWWDVIALSKFAHDNIAHGILSLWKRPHQQKRYPNFAQSLFHAWCRLPVWVKLGAIAALFVGIGNAIDGALGLGVAIAVVIFVLR